MKDWIGDKNSVYKTLAASNHSDIDRETNDYYATDPKALELFLNRLKQDNITLHSNIWECACGEGNLSKILINRGYHIYSSDLINRGYGDKLDFLKYNESISMDILINPPYKYALDFVKHALDILNNNYFAIFFLKIQFLEGKERYKFFKENPPKYVYVHSERQKCALNNDFENVKSSAVCYAWYIWQKGWKGETIIRWI